MLFVSDSVEDHAEVERSTCPTGALRLAIVTSSAAVGGTESQAALLSRSLRAAGAHVAVTVLDGNCADQEWGGDRLRVARPGRYSSLFACVALGRLLWDVALGRVDVVHCLMAKAHTIVPLLVSLTPSRSRPLVVAWRRNVGAHSGRPYLDRLEALAARRCDLLIGNSQGVRDFWLARGHTPRFDFEVIQNALEDWRFGDVVPATLKLAERHLVTVGNLREVKGHSDLIDAALVVRSMGHDVGVVIVGQGDCEARIRGHAADSGVPLLIVAGVSDPRPYLRAADVYVHPSHSEGSSNAVAEALAQGARVVSTDTGTARELVHDERFIVPPHRPDLLAEAVAVRLAEPGSEDDAAASVRELTPERMVAHHVDVYRRGIANVRHRRKH